MSWTQCLSQIRPDPTYFRQEKLPYNFQLIYFFVFLRSFILFLFFFSLISLFLEWLTSIVMEFTQRICLNILEKKSVIFLSFNLVNKTSNYETMHSASFCIWFLDVMDVNGKTLQGWPSINGSVYHLAEASGTMEFTAATDSFLTAQIHHVIFLLFCGWTFSSNPQCSEDQKKKGTLHINCCTGIWGGCVLFFGLGFFFPVLLLVLSLASQQRLEFLMENGDPAMAVTVQGYNEKTVPASRAYLTFFNCWCSLRLQSSKLEVFCLSHSVLSKSRKTRLSSGL